MAVSAKGKRKTIAKQDIRSAFSANRPGYADPTGALDELRTYFACRSVEQVKAATALALPPHSQGPRRRHFPNQGLATGEDMMIAGKAADANGALDGREGHS